MDSAVQPILCCLGQSVGDCPTQYLMELSFADQQLDWRAITVEVKPGELQTAIEGARAMGFRGLRFFGPVQTIASEFLGAGNLPVSSAMATDCGWQAWHTDAFVLFDLLSRHDKPLQKVALFGDTPQTRRIYGGLLNKYCIDTPPLDVEVEWIGVGADAVEPDSKLTILKSEDDLIANLRAGSSAPPDCLVGCAFETALETAQLITSAAQERELANQLSTDSGDLNAEKESPETTPQQSSGTTVADARATADIASQGPVWWLPAPDDAVVRSQSALDRASIRRVSRTDLLLAGEQFDFARWTGQTISLAILRDSYDEFNAF